MSPVMARCDIGQGEVRLSPNASVRGGADSSQVLDDLCVTDDDWRAWPDGREHVAFVLGAGFSRAISELMPLTDELGLAALAKLRPALPPRLALDQFPSGLNFEAWLSQLAGDQPYLSVADNAENRVAFLRFSEAIAQILGERVNGVLASHYPEWLLELLSAAHHTRATLITFNYDTLIECLVDTPTGILGNPNEYGEVWQGVSWTELTGGLPPWAPGDAPLASSRVESVRLLKLHGSLNWYWQPGDISGISVARRPLPGHFAKPVPYTEEQRRRDVPGRAPFVVPPAASKSEYYSNPITKEMWTQAAERLAGAQRVVFMGYSFPPTDVTFTNMLRASIQESDCDIVIADHDPTPVQRRLTELGISQERIHIGPSGPDAIKTLVQSWTLALSQATLDDFSPADASDRRLVLSWGDKTAYAPVEKLESTQEGLVAIAHRVFPSFAAAAGISSPTALPAADLIAQRDTHAWSGRPTLYAKPSGQGGHVIAKYDYSPGLPGQETGTWLVLQVAATPPPIHLSD
jgi:hypothetical protein